MKKILLALTLVAAAGCNFKDHYVPDSGLVLAHADYTVMGATSAEACGTYIFGIDFGHLFTDSQGASRAAAGGDPLSAVLGMLPFGGGVPEEGRAMYDALEKMPEATHLLANKAHVTTTGFAPFHMPIFGKRCAAVEARGVKIGKGPVPNAQ